MTDFETMPIGTKERIKELERKLGLAVEALGFYADGTNNWETSQSLQWSCILPEDVEHIDDSGFRLRGGKRARQCLKEIKENCDER